MGRYRFYVFALLHFEETDDCCMAKRSEASVFPYHLVVIFLALAIGIGIAGYLYNGRQEAQIRRDAAEEISTVAQLKVSEISAWRQERMSNAEVIFESPFTSGPIREWRDNPASGTLTRALSVWMASLKGQYGYNSALLVGPAGNVLLSLPEGEAVCSHILNALHEAEHMRKPVLTDIHHSSVDDDIHLALIIPIIDPRDPDALPLVTLLLLMDPRQYLYPLVQSYPTPSLTAEALLVRREGDEIVFLNELRHKKDTALSLRLPANDEVLPAARAANGQRGVFEGIDYRGVPVLAVAQPIPDSSWLLIAKIDLAEVQARSRSWLGIAALMVGMMIAGAGVCVGLVWRYQRMAFYRGQYEMEREKLELAERYELLTRYANDIVLLFDPATRIVEANDRAVSAYGYERDELLRLSVEDIRASETLTLIEEQKTKVRQQDGFVFETVHRRKDGTTFPVEVSSRIVKFGDSSFYWSIIRDIGERKRAEEKLRESENTYKTIFENTGTATIIIEEDTTVSLANKECETLTGYSREELLGNVDWKSFIASDEFEMISNYHFSRRKDPSSVPSKYECKFVDRFGNIKEILTTVALIPGTTKSVASLLDITERKRMESALRESEEKFSKAFHSSPSIITFSTVKDGRLIEVNDRFRSVFGYEPGEVIGLTSLELDLWADPNDRTKVMDLISKQGSVRNLEVTLRRRSGEEFIALVSMDVVELKGEPCLLSAVSDITELKRTEGALRESDRRFREILEDIKLVALILNDQGRITFCNDFLLELTGWQLNEVLGQDWFQMFIPSDLREEIEAVFHASVSDDRFPSHYENDILTSSGKRRMIAWKNTLLHDVMGKIVGITSIGEDITDRSMLENRLRQTQKMEAIGTLAGGIAHDFNNILGAIMGFTEITLFDLPRDNPMRPNLEQVLRAAHRAKDLVRQILAFSRMGEQKRTPMEIGSVIKEVLKLLRASLPTTIEIRQDLSTVPGRMALANPTQIHQVLMNLCTNAGHAMRETGGILGVTLSEVQLDKDTVAPYHELKPGRHFKLSVTDTGHGMDHATLERIFDPFFTTKGPGEGTGMGLAVAHGIVKSHGGAIAVYSEPGHGSIFNVYLPCLESGIVDLPDGDPTLPGGKERILLVDDEEVLIDMGRRMLERLGYKVLSKMSGSEAISLFRDQPDQFDLVITDYTMPHMTGMGLAREMMRIRPDIPIILCTGFSEMISEENAKKVGIREFIMKPLTWSELAGAVRRALS